MDYDQPKNAFLFLTDEQRKQLLISYEGSFDESNLLSHEEVMHQHGKWLKSDR
jgi:hypothetical protein